MKWTAFIILVWGLLTGTLRGAPYYVGLAATGDGSGSDRNNLMALSHAQTIASPGDTFKIVPGDYGAWDVGNACGTADDWITWEADTEHPNYVARSSDWFQNTLNQDDFTTSNSPIFLYISIPRLSDTDINYAKPRYLRLRNLVVKPGTDTTGGAIICQYQVAYVEISGCTVFGFNQSEPYYYYGDYPDVLESQFGISGTLGMTGNGIWLRNGLREDLRYITVDSCYVDHVLWGINFAAGGTTCPGVVISNNHIHDTASPGISVDWTTTNVDTVTISGNHIDTQQSKPYNSSIAGNGDDTGTITALDEFEPRRIFDVTGIVGIDSAVRVTPASHPEDKTWRWIASGSTATHLICTEAFPWDLAVGDTIEVMNANHGAGIAWWRSKVTISGNFIHASGNSGPLYAYQRDTPTEPKSSNHDILIENNVSYCPQSIICSLVWTGDSSTSGGVTGHRYAGDNITIRNNTIVGRRFPQSSDISYYGNALRMVAAPDTDFSTWHIDNNLFIGKVELPTGAAFNAHNNISWWAPQLETDLVGVNANNINYCSGAIDTSYEFDQDKGYFTGGSAFWLTYAFGDPYHLEPAPNIAYGRFYENMNLDWRLTGIASAVGYAYTGDVPEFDIQGTRRSLTAPSVGAFEYNAAPPPDYPGPPYGPEPSHTATGVARNATLHWHSDDPDTDSFKVYWDPGTGTPTTLRATVTDTFWNPPTMSALTTYSWQIVAHNEEGGYSWETEGPVWTYTTRAPGTTEYLMLRHN
jgi:hypothetical protein